MKRFLTLLIVVFTILLFPIYTFADDYQDYLNGYDLSAFDTLDNDTKRVLDYFELTDFDYQNISDLSIDKLIKYIKNLFGEKSKIALKALTELMLLILVNSFVASVVNEKNKKIFEIISNVSLTIFLTSSISNCLALCCSTIRLCADFTFAFFPAFCVISATSGAAISSISVNSTLLILSQALNYISKLIFLPFIQCFMSFAICSTICEDLNLSGAVSSFRRLITKAISTIAGIYVAILSMKTAVASRADALGIRSMRFAINSVVPVIGGTISEGLLSIQAYSSLIKTSVGIIGIIAVILVFLPSIIEIVSWRLVLNLSSICAQAFNCTSLKKVINAFLDSLLLINVVQILSMVTTIISIGILIATRSV